jgi:Na+-translocating ferredoxin:NAD+ oxidoreductase RnfD subunit
MIKILFKLEARWYVVIAILWMAFSAVRSEGAIVFSHTIPICLISCLLDLAVIYIRDRKIAFPLSALVSGLIISAVLAPAKLFYIAPVAAILSKHIIKVSGRHIFNPAGFGLFVSNAFFGLSLSWWLVESPAIIIAFGLFLAYKIRKFSLILSFSVSAAVLSVGYSLFMRQMLLAHLHIINPFFVLFMLTEPKTSPAFLRSKLIYGAVVSLCVTLSFIILPRYDFSIMGLMVGNIFGVFLKRRAV